MPLFCLALRAMAVAWRPVCAAADWLRAARVAASMGEGRRSALLRARTRWASGSSGGRRGRSSARSDCGVRASKQEHDDLGAFGLLECALNAHVFYGVGRLAQAGGVDEAEEGAADVEHFFHRVARGAVNVAHNGALFAEQGVEQGGLAYVRFAHDGAGDAASNGIAKAEGVAESLHAPFGVGEQAQKFGAVGELEVFVVGKIEFQFEHGVQVEEGFAQAAEFLAEVAAQLAHGEVVLRLGLRCDDVGHGFGLREVEFAVEKGALCEFARVGLPRTALLEQRHQPRGNIRRGVARDFHSVFAREGMWRAIDGEHGFVEHAAVGCVGESAEERLPRRGFCEGTREEAVGRCNGFAAAQAHKAEGAA